MFHHQVELQDHQERQVGGCRDYYTEVSQDRRTVRDNVDAPLERTRLYGPFPLDVVRWALILGKDQLTMGVDADGREFVEY